MNTKQQWKLADRLDTIMNVLLIVLALGVMGAGALEMESALARGASSAGQRA
jgi:hypothetical protein